MTLRRVVAGTWTVVDTRDGGCFSSILFCFFASFCPNVLACGVGCGGDFQKIRKEI